VLTKDKVTHCLAPEQSSMSSDVMSVIGWSWHAASY